MNKNRDITKNHESEKDDNTEVNNISENIERAIEDIPEPQTREVLMRMMSVSRSEMISAENTIANKITEQHITQFLDGSKADMENSYIEKKQKKIFLLFGLVMVMIFFVVVIILLKDTPEIMEKIITAVGGAIAGAFGGYGFGKSKSEN